MYKQVVADWMLESYFIDEDSSKWPVGRPHNARQQHVYSLKLCPGRMVLVGRQWRSCGHHGGPCRTPRRAPRGSLGHSFWKLETNYYAQVTTAHRTAVFQIPKHPPKRWRFFITECWVLCENSFRVKYARWNVRVSHDTDERFASVPVASAVEVILIRPIWDAAHGR